MRFDRIIMSAAMSAALTAGLAAQGPSRAASVVRTLRGTTVQAGAATPIAGARVTAIGSRARVESGVDGTFAVGVGTNDTLVVHAIGFVSARVAVGIETTIRVTMTAAPAALPDLIVSAARRTQRASETATSVATVTKADLEGAAAVSVDQAVTMVPGVDILPNAPTGSNLSIRGIDGARVLVMVDGEPVMGSLLENRDLSRLSTAGAERIEVVKGPQSALYGSDAIGGVINLVTSDPTGPLSLSGQARFGSQGRRDAELTAQAGGDIRYRITGGWREQGTVASVTRSDDALNRVWDMRATARTNLSPSIGIRADVAGLRERQRWRVSSDGYNGFNDNVGANGFVEGDWQRGNSGWRSRLSYERYEHRYRSARATSPIANDPALPQTEWAAKGIVAWNGRVAAQTFDAGIEAGRREIESPGKIDGKVADDQVEGFLQASLVVGDLLITPASRVSWNSRWGSSITPGVNAAWLVSPALRLRGGVARGFRGPSFKELLWDFPNPSAGYTIKGNPDLVPERSLQVSTGATIAIGSATTFDVEVFRNEIRDLIELADGGVDPATNLLSFTPTNVSQARTQGAEAELRWSKRTVSVALGYAFLDAKDRGTGEPLERRARHSGRLKASWRSHPTTGLRADLITSITGTAPMHDLDGAEATRARFVSTSFQLGYDLSRTFGISLGGDNLLDETPEGWSGVYGRRVFMGFRATWRSRSTE